MIKAGDRFETPKELAYQGAGKVHVCIATLNGRRVRTREPIRIVCYVWKGCQYGVGEFQVRKITQAEPQGRLGI